MSKSNLGGNQILQQSYDETTKSLKVSSISGVLVSEQFDFIGVTYPSSTQEVYTYRLGGISGTIVATVTINYTNASKENLLNVSKA